MKARDYRDADGDRFTVWTGGRSPRHRRIMIGSDGVVALDAEGARTLAADLIAFADSQTETTEKEG